MTTIVFLFRAALLAVIACFAAGAFGISNSVRLFDVSVLGFLAFLDLFFDWVDEWR